MEKMIFPEVDRASIESRFHEKYIPEPNSGCWLWTASLNNKGYAELMLRHTRRVAYAHRISYQLFVGNIPTNGQVLHSCDVSCCVNPNHLRIGTTKDNMGDMAKRGRSRRGRSFPNEWKLTPEQVLLIRGSKTLARIMAEKYGVTRQTIYNIRNNKTRINVQ